MNCSASGCFLASLQRALSLVSWKIDTACVLKILFELHADLHIGWCNLELTSSVKSAKSFEVDGSDMGKSVSCSFDPVISKGVLLVQSSSSRETRAGPHLK